jgi:TATA-binding protein-associated factor
MPNYLGTESYFGKEFAKPISNSQLPGASGDEIHTGNEKLKGLHQQVLPFILRRDKQQVLKELPPKVISNIPCMLGPEQSRLYASFCASPEAKEALNILHKALLPGDSIRKGGSGNHECYFDENSLGNQVLKSMLYLRLLCTHPVLVSSKNKVTKNTKTGVITSKPTDLVGNGEYARLDCSGKLSILNELLRSAGIFHRELTAADNDDSAIYLLDPPPGSSTVSNEFASSFTDKEGGGNSDISVGECGFNTGLDSLQSSSKCLIFAQFTQSLDVVEQFLFEPHMPSLRYLRLDGRVPVADRSAIVDQFNQDESIKVLLLTTRIGGLGLNLTGTCHLLNFVVVIYDPVVFSYGSCICCKHSLYSQAPIL